MLITLTPHIHIHTYTSQTCGHARTDAARSFQGIRELSPIFCYGQASCNKGLISLTTRTRSTRSHLVVSTQGSSKRFNPEIISRTYRPRGTCRYARTRTVCRAISSLPELCPSTCYRAASYSRSMSRSRVRYIEWVDIMFKGELDRVG